MSNVPLPIRSCIVTYMGDGRGLHYTLGVAAGTALIEQPPGSQLDLYTADQMRSYAAAATAAKAAEIAALRAEVAGLRAELLKSLADNAALRKRVRELTTQAMFNTSTIERLRAEVEGLRECAIDLWMMLDDIDTGGDRAKADDVLYRAIAERTHRRRFSPKYQIVIDAIDAARKGEATTPPPSPSPRS